MAIYLSTLVKYRKSSINPKGGLFNFRASRGGMNREGAYFKFLLEKGLIIEGA